MTYFVILKEVTLFSLFWFVLTSKKVVILDVQPALLPISAYLKNIIFWLHKRRYIQVASIDYPDYLIYDTFSGATYFDNLAVVLRLTDIYRRSEPWQEIYFEFDKADQHLGDYALPFRSLTGNYLQKKYCLLYNIHSIAKQADSNNFRIVGMCADMKSFYADHFAEKLNIQANPVWECRSVTNFLLSVGSFGATLIWILKRIRPFHKVEKNYFLGCDYFGDSRELELLREIQETEKPAMVVYRNRTIKHIPDDRASWQTCTADDGRLSVFAGLSAITHVALGIAKLYLWGNRLSPELFRQIITLPYKTIQYRALFSRFVFQYFWCRDDYNVDHIIRSQELRKAGGKTIGIMHGFPVVSPIVQQTRYVDFDLYYVFGEAISRHHYGPKWPKEMRIKAINSFGLSRSRLHELSPESLKNDIFCVLSWNPIPWNTFEALRSIANAFPDRKVILTTKARQRRGPYGKILDGFLSDCPENIEEFTGDTYALFNRCKYLVSEPSTLVLEGIQFGTYVFALELPPKWAALTLNEFPELCLRSADEAIDRIRSLEDGSWKYPRHLYKDNVEMSGRIVWDIIREDMGLSAREGPIKQLMLDNLPT